MNDRKGKDKKKLKRIKTGRWERQWSLTKTGVKVGSTTAAQMWGSAFLTKSSRQQRQQKILSEQAQYLADELGKLKGSVVKIGQIMALYGEHILPEEVTDALRSLEENTLSLEWEVIQPILEKELGSAYQDFDIEKEAIGAASLAQVHRAIHLPTGENVCLKMQYPGVAEAIDSDLNAVLQILKLTRMVSFGKEFNEWVEEVRQLLHYEVDYHREVEMMQRFTRFLDGNSSFKVPVIYSQYCSRRLIVSSFEAGVAVNDESVLSIDQTIRNQLGRDFLELFLKEVFVWGEMQTDPNFGNYRIQTDEGRARIVLLDFGAVLSYDDSFLSPVKHMVLGAYEDDYLRIKTGAIEMGMMKEEYPEEVHKDFSLLCTLLVEPFVYHGKEVPEEAVNDKGHYRWAHSQLPKRAAKHAARSAMSRYFAMPPKEFAFLSRKLLGVYSFIAALESEFDSGSLLEQYGQSI